MSPPESRIAVIDVGSNSIRLFLCDGADPAGPRGARTTTVVGLRRGAADDGTLSDDALARLDDARRDAIQKQAAMIRTAGANRV